MDGVSAGRGGGLRAPAASVPERSGPTGLAVVDGQAVLGVRSREWGAANEGRASWDRGEVP